jgi:hypothetical protein
MLARDLDRGIGGAADKDGNAFAAIRLDVREAILNLIIFAVVGKRLFAGPFGSNDIQKLVGARVTFVLVVNGVAVLLQLVGVASGDDMQGNPATGKLIDGGKLAGDQRRCGEAGPLRNQDMKPIGYAKHMLADLKPVRRSGMKCQ